MGDWFRRQAQRSRDLARGADADLVRYNQKRFQLSLYFLVFGLALIAVDWKAHLQGRAHDVVVWIGIACFVAGFVSVRWAAAEDAFLHRPDPKEPPSLFKF
ncbi:MAG: hypothetical protein WA639_03780 [Candidatus Acidiferrum sp.]